MTTPNAGNTAETGPSAADTQEAAPPVESPEPAAETRDDANQGADSEPANRQAARYRTALRAAEQERDTLRDQVAAMQRVDAERMAAGHLTDPADLWRDGLDIDELRDDDGRVDPEKLNHHVAALLDQHPHWRRQRRGIARNFASGASGNTSRAEPSWSAVLRDSR